ncbi:MAG: hypothetical protein ACK4QL_08495 [Pseudanabaenaceae cyanobacterium]
MANLTIEQSSKYELIMFTPRLKKLIIEGTFRQLIVPGFVLLLSFIHFLSSKYPQEESKPTYLYEMTCERLKKNFVNCKLEKTDIEGKKATVFSTPIKSATYSVLTTDDGYTCSVSLVKRDGGRINNLELFTNKESSRECPRAKAVVNQINQ